jgi:hypothetical protein
MKKFLIILAVVFAAVALQAQLLNEGFEGATFPPTGWTVHDADTITPTWARFSSYVHGGSYSAWHKWGGSTDEQNGWLVSTPVTLGAGTYAISWYDYNLYPGDYANNYLVISNTAMPWQELGAAVLWNPTSVAEAWTQQIVNIPADWNNRTVYLSWRYLGTYAHAWIIDDVLVYDTSAGDVFPPEITTLPLLCTPNPNENHYVDCTVTDDSAVTGVNLFFAYGTADADPVYYSAMTQDADDPTLWHGGFLAGGVIPDTLFYWIEATDEHNNVGETEVFVFLVDDPVWVYYDYAQNYSGLMPGSLGTNTWGAFNIFYNPYYGTGNSLYLYQAEAATFYPQTGATLQVYLFDPDVETSPVSRAYYATPITVNMTGAAVTGGGWDTFTFADYGNMQPVEITDPFFAIAIENLPDTGNQSTNSFFVFDPTYDYGMYGLTLSTNPGVWYTFTNRTGAWSISANIGIGNPLGVEAPIISIALDSGYPTITWNEVTGAQSYNVYGSNDPYAAQPWTAIETGIGDLGYAYQGTEPYKFFYVTASTELDGSKTANTEIAPKITATPLSINARSVKADVTRNPRLSSKTTTLRNK